jgi:hypothetical protein
MHIYMYIYIHTYIYIHAGSPGVTQSELESMLAKRSHEEIASEAMTIRSETVRIMRENCAKNDKFAGMIRDAMYTALVSGSRDLTSLMIKDELARRFLKNSVGGPSEFVEGDAHVVEMLSKCIHEEVNGSFACMYVCVYVCMYVCMFYCGRGAEQVHT